MGGKGDGRWQPHRRANDADPSNCGKITRCLLPRGMIKGQKLFVSFLLPTIPSEAIPHLSRPQPRSHHITPAHPRKQAHIHHRQWVFTPTLHTPGPQTHSTTPSPQCRQATVLAAPRRTGRSRPNHGDIKAIPNQQILGATKAKASPRRRR
jgi:hypothetical protein